MPEIKDQLDCGSCYIFAALAIVEHDSKVRLQKDHYLADQDPLECMGGNNCDGKMSKLFDFLGIL